uniref:Uncharacterized protein n=1 Tax=Octopus bimaculoides TaxID=37653 RepID=A0A0L8IA63_OCTBM
MLQVRHTSFPNHSTFQSPHPRPANVQESKRLGEVTADLVLLNSPKSVYSSNKKNAYYHKMEKKGRKLWKDCVYVCVYCFISPVELCT